MAEALLFDFFGTLVEYRAARVGHAYPQTVELAQSLGFDGDHDQFASAWDTSMSALEREGRATLQEFSMLDVAVAFCAGNALPCSESEMAALGRSFVGEWAYHVVPIDGVAEMLARLAADHRIAVVSNTHDRNMVPDMLVAMGVADLMTAVVLSVDHGWQKPHHSIYEAAIDQIGSAPGSTVFIGDNVEADHAGPKRMGMQAFLIDPADVHGVPATERLATVLDLEGALRSSG